MSTDELAKLRKQRGGLRTVVTKILKQIETNLGKTDVDIDVLEVDLQQLLDRAETLKHYDEEVEHLLKIEDIDAEMEKVEEYREKIVRWKFKAEKQIRLANQNTVKDISFSNASNSEESGIKNEKRETIKLPKISIPKFYGDTSQWLSFWNSFEISIHKNNSLEKIDKFIYLRAHLGGTALSTIEGFALSPENYDSAIDLLEKRFGTKDVLINAHIDNLLKINPLRSSNDIKAFRKMFDHCQTHIRSLEALDVVSDKYGSLLCPLLLNLLPSDLILEYNKREKKDSNYNLEELMEFLSQQLSARERTFSHSKLDERRRFIPPANVRHNENKQSSTPFQRRQPVTASELLSVDEMKPDKRYSCIFCEGSHLSPECENAMYWSLDEKKQKLLKKGACFKCLKTKHLARFCRAKVNCSVCGRAHFSIMCWTKSENNDDKDAVKCTEHIKENKDCVLANKTFTEFVFLQTLVVKLLGNGTERYVRILIDSGSQRSYISKYAASVMNYEAIGNEELIHGLFGGIEKGETHTRYLIRMSSIKGDYLCNFQVLDQDKICTDIPQIRPDAYLNELREGRIYLTDMKNKSINLMYEKSPLEIHVLIGADVAGKLLTGRIKQLACGLSCVHTRLGWTIMGPTEGHEPSGSTQTVLSLHVNDAKISDLWCLDSLGITEPTATQSKREMEEAAREYFIRSLERGNDGRYQVSLPWLENHPVLPDNKLVSERRLKSCVKNLQMKHCLKEYEKVFDEWEEEQVIESIDPSKTSVCHYLPHRAVFREKSTTKIRPVFDASAREKSCVSLNDCLEKGPNYLELIPSIINRFRVGNYGITSDIRKAFLQIAVNPRDRDFLRFLWWEEGDPSKLKVYRHRRVVFGVNASPFLLSATLNYHLENVPEDQQEVAEKLRKSMYVDNCVTSVDTLEQVNNFIVKSKEIMMCAKFDLRGWKHNKPVDEVSEVVSCDEEYNEEVSVLGLKWNILKDTLSCDFKDDSLKQSITKRSILCKVHRIFDPIGFTTPVTLIPKLMLQECWKLKVSWDDNLPNCLSERFENWERKLYHLKNLSIPRRIFINSDEVSGLSLHVFCDASKVAFATCIFIRSSNRNSVTCQLVQSRSKVAPIKTISIPRLELLACNIGARLARRVKEDLKLESVPTYYWSDSTNVLYWIKKNENWATFVANRITEIRTLSNPDDWYYVPGTQNPADLPSRGCGPETLAKTKWWEGPTWLKNAPEEWPSHNDSSPNFEIIDAERRKMVISTVNSESKSDTDFDRISCYNKILKVISWIFRFCQNAREKPAERILSKITAEEVKKAEIVLLRLVQRESFTGLEDKNLRALQPMIDSDGLLRVKTRILEREDTENFRFPIILPSDHPIVTKLIRRTHETMNHAGVHFLISALREDYWILKTRKTVKRVIRSCVKCRRFDSKPVKTPTAPLPKDRVREAAVFEIVGVDLTGPLILKNNQKSWIVIFTCAVFRAVHLELVLSLSTENFLQAFRRFIARRGRPHTVYSDNGTNFTGSDRLFNSINWEIILEYATVSRITWKFLPPSAPWWGGWWERLIGVLKRILRKVLGKSSLNSEELLTVLCECESILNDRPITYVSENTDDLEPLKPSMFLKEIKEVGVPDLDYLDSVSLNKRYKYRQQLKDDLRKRFRSEYLGQLRQNTEYVKEARPVKIGDVVIIHSDNSKRIDWLLAKVVEVYKGKDGHVRLAKVKTKFGELLRPTKKLYPLEINASEDSSLIKRALQLSDKDTNGPLRSRHGRRIKPPHRLDL